MSHNTEPEDCLDAYDMQELNFLMPRHTQAQQVLSGQADAQATVDMWNSFLARLSAKYNLGPNDKITDGQITRVASADQQTAMAVLDRLNGQPPPREPNRQERRSLEEERRRIDARLASMPGALIALSSIRTADAVEDTH